MDVLVPFHPVFDKNDKMLKLLTRLNLSVSGQFVRLYSQLIIWYWSSCTKYNVYCRKCKLCISCIQCSVWYYFYVQNSHKGVRKYVLKPQSLPIISPKIGRFLGWRCHFKCFELAVSFVVVRHYAGKRKTTLIESFFTTIFYF